MQYKTKKNTKKKRHVSLRTLSNAMAVNFSESSQQKAGAVLSDIRHAIKHNFGFISAALMHHENADPKWAQIAFDALIENIKDDLFIGTTDDWTRIVVGKQILLYRHSHHTKERVFQGQTGESFSSEIRDNADELFHIPISRSQNTSNARFGLAGFPSLYLSMMLPLA